MVILLTITIHTGNIDEKKERKFKDGKRDGLK